VKPKILIIYQGKFVSRILSSPIIYLAPTLPSGSCGTPPLHNSRNPKKQETNYKQISNYNHQN